METSANKRLTTPIRTVWLVFLFCLLVAIVALTYYIEHYTEPEAGWRRNPIVFVPAILITGIILGFHHTIMEQGICVNYFGIPIRFVPWTAVTHAVHIRTVNGKKNKTQIIGSGIFISLNGCPPLIPGIDDYAFARAKHPINTIFIRLPDEDAVAAPYVKLFKNYYPALAPLETDNP